MLKYFLQSIASIAIVIFVTCLLVYAAGQTGNLLLDKPDRGDADWDTTINANMELIDDAIGDYDNAKNEGASPNSIAGWLIAIYDEIYAARGLSSDLATRLAAMSAGASEWVAITSRTFANVGGSTTSFTISGTSLATTLTAGRRLQLY